MSGPWGGDRLKSRILVCDSQRYRRFNGSHFLPIQLIIIIVIGLFTLSITNWSKALGKSEKRYSATDLECKCIHDSVMHWGHYLRNNLEFEVITDHYALVYMLVKASKSRNGPRLEV
jgi:hypothetical protein